MNKCNPKEIIRDIPNIQTVILPPHWFEHLRDNCSVFDSLYNWMFTENIIPTENKETIHNRTYIGEKLYKKLINAERKRLKRKLKIDGEKLKTAVSWSDMNSGPKTKIGELKISGEVILIIPESSRQALSEFSIKIQNNERDTVIKRIKSTAAGATFYQWLLSQIERPDRVGNSARDAASDQTYPQKSNNYEEIQYYLNDLGASSGAIESFNIGWLEYIDQYPERIKPYAICSGCDKVLEVNNAFLVCDNNFLELSILGTRCLEKYSQIENYTSYPLTTVSEGFFSKLHEESEISKFEINRIKEQLLLQGISLSKKTKTDGKGLVYFIMSEKTQNIKIGFTARDIKVRLNALQTANPYKLKVLATLNGNKDHEKALHNKFSQFRLEGEWFEPHPDLLAFISLLQV